jgi:hypothetical protein
MDEREPPQSFMGQTYELDAEVEIFLEKVFNLLCLQQFTYAIGMMTEGINRHESFD